MGDGVLDDEEDGDGDHEGEGSGSGQIVVDVLALVVLFHGIALAGPAVDEAGSENAQDGAVGQVHGEAVASDPHEHLVGEDALQGRRQPDSGHGEVPSQGGPATRPV